MIKLFSEKVDATFTSSDRNILQVESFEEIFFDVFEFEINGRKYIAEKVTEYEGSPVITVPIVRGSERREAQFVLQEGPFSVSLNIDNSVFIENVLSVEENIEWPKVSRLDHTTIKEELPLIEKKIEEKTNKLQPSVLKVEDYEEIYFDVLEFSIKGKKRVAEKIAEINGDPVVSLIADGKQTEFVLRKNNDTNKVLLQQNKVPKIEENKEELHKQIASKSLKLIEQVQKAKTASIQQAQQEKSEQVKKVQAENQHKKDFLAEEINKIKISLQESFNNYTQQATELLSESSSETEEKIASIIDTYVVNTSKYVEDISNNLQNQISDGRAENLNRITEDVNTLATSLQAFVEDNNNKLTADVYAKVEAKLDSTQQLFEQKIGESSDSINQLFKTDILAIEATSNELKEEITRATNKALSRIGNVRTELERVVNETKEQIDATITDTNNIVESNKVDTDRLIKETENNIRAFVDSSVKDINERVNSSKDDIASNKKELLNLVNLTEEKINNSISEFSSNIKSVENTVDANITEVVGLIELTKKNNEDSVEGIKQQFKDSIDSTANVISNNKSEIIDLITHTEDKINKSVENVKGQVNNLKGDTKNIISSNNKELKGLIKIAENKIKGYYDSRLKIIEESLKDSTNNKDEILTLINDSKESVLKEVAEISVSAIVSDKESNSETHKKQIEKLVNDKLKNEIQSLKKMIEMYSGGGSVAKQFADGGVMNGDLLIVGSLSAREYLGLGGVSGLYLPLSGGTLFGDLAFNTGSINNVNTIQFNTTLETIPNTGQIGWNTADGTLDVGLQDGTILPVGEKEIVYVKAKQNIKNGQCVYASGASGGGSGNIEVSLFSAAAGVVDELRFLGVATEDIAINGFGYVATFGKIKGVSPADTRGTDDPQYSLPNNQGWTIGTILYISATSPGKYTSVPPTAPNLRIATAIVIAENGNQRILFVRAEHGYHLNELHDVKIVDPQNNQLLSYNKTLSTWENKSNITVNTLSATSIYALSSFVDVIDIKQYELSGFSVSGDVVINGNVSVTGTVDGRDVSNDGIKLDSVYINTNTLSANWQNTYTTVNTNSANWDYQGSDIKALSGNWQNTYTTVNANSSNWSYQGSDIKALSANWEGTYTTVGSNSASWDYQGNDIKSLSANWQNTFTTVDANSSNWESTYTTVESNSSNWDYQGSDIKALSANWENTYTTVNANSSNWDYQGSDIKALSANWESTYTTVESNSANWDYQGSDIKSLSANWQSTYTTVDANSANWSSSYNNQNALSANWQNTYTSYSTNSATFVTYTGSTQDVDLGSNNLTTTGYVSAGTAFVDSLTANNFTALSAIINVIDIKQYELSGFSVSGDVVINGNISVTGTVDGRDVSSDGIKLDSVFNNQNALSANWESTYTTVESNSSNWDYQGNDIKALSANWENTYTTVDASSGNWQNTYTTVESNSSNWSSSYNNQNALSANWQNTYTTVGSNSADWDYQGNDIKALSANWESTYTTVDASSANWQNTYTTVGTNSATWDYQGNDIKALSGNWQNTYTTVESNSANWSSSYDNQNALSANWQNTYTTVESNSSNWQNTYTSYSTNSSTFVTYTGATQDVDLGSNDLTTTGYVSAGSLVVDTDTLYVDSATNRVGIGIDTPSYKLDVNGDANISTSLTVGTNLDVGGHFSAVTKSFLIDNPIKENRKLQYGVVESNQHSVFVRGKTSNTIITLPEEWEWLVHRDSVTVQLTPVGAYQQLFVISQSNKQVEIGGVTGVYNYTIYGERKDVAKLETEV